MKDPGMVGQRLCDLGTGSGLNQMDPGGTEIIKILVEWVANIKKTQAAVADLTLE